MELVQVMLLEMELHMFQDQSPPAILLLDTLVLPLMELYQEEHIKLLLNKSQSNQEFNIFLSKKNILSMIELKGLKEFHMKDKL